MADDHDAAPLSEAAQLAIAYLGNPGTVLNEAQVGLAVLAIYSAVELRDMGAEPAVDTPRPAVPIDESIGSDFIVCLEDGKRLKMLKRYLRAQYKMSPEEYRAKWGLPADYPMVAESYSAERSGMAKAQGLGRRSVPILRLRPAAN